MPDLPANNVLSSDEQKLLLDIIHSLHAIQSTNDFQKILSDHFQKLLPHEVVVCGIGRSHLQTIHIEKLLSINFPEEYLKEIKQSDGGILSPIIMRWAKHRTPQIFEAQTTDNINQDWLNAFNKYDLRNILAHGMHDLSSNAATYFSFSRLPEKPAERHAYVLQLIVPHLHIAFTRVMGNISKVAEQNIEKFSLTPREKEILSWLQHGKTNWEIGQILGATEKTIKNHMNHIFDKLGVSNRTQAVLKISRMQILEVD
jgi:transcriptional regulator EpsA